VKRHFLPPLDANRVPFIDASMVVRSSSGH